MADVQKTIEIIFAGTDRVSGTIGDMSGKIGDFAGSVEDATKPLLDLSTAILKVDAVLGAMAIGGIAVAINQAGKFGDSFAEISTLTDATGDALNTFEADILSYSRNSTASIDDINGAIYSAISAGTDYKDSLELLTISEQLSVAGKADLEATTRVLVSSLNAYGASTDEATAYSDALFKTVKLGQTTLPELAQSLAQVSTTAANSGVPFDTLMAALAAVTATGLPTTLAITSIKQAISAIINPTAEAVKEAGKLGISFDASALASRGLDGVLKDVYAATGGATDKITELFGSVESLPAVMTLGADTTGKFAANLIEFKSKAGATAEAYAKMAANMILANQNLANNVNATFIQIGSELLETYSGIVSELADVFKAVGTSIDAGTFDSVFTAFNTVGDDIATFLEDLAKSLPDAFKLVDWTDFIKSMDGLKGAFGDIFGDFDPSDPKDVADAIKFVLDSLESLKDVTKGMTEIIGPIVQTIVGWAKAFNDLDSDTKELIGNVIEIGAVTSVAAGFFVTAAVAVKAMSFALSTLGVKAAVTSITSMGPAIATVIGTTGGQAGLLGLAAAAGYAAGTIINDNVPAVTTISQAVLGWADSILNFTGTQKDANQTIEENEAFISAQNMALERAANAVNDLEDEISDADLKIQIGMDNLEDDLNSIDWSDWVNDANTALTVTPTVEEDKFLTDLEDALNAENWDDWDDPHSTIGVDVDDADIDKAKKKLTQEFSNASMGDINLGFDFGGDGVGPAEGLKKAFESMDPIPAEDLFDMSGLADLFDAIKDVESPLKQQAMTAALIKQLELRNKAIEAQNRLTMTQAAIAADMARAADVMWQTSQSGDSMGTIKLEMSGVEPEVEAIMWKVLKAVQVRANESGAEFLLASAG